MDSSVTRYLIIGMGRSGTTAVHHCLRGHPEVSAYWGEVALEPFFVQGLASLTNSEPTSKQHRAQQLALFDAVATVDAETSMKAAGAKCAYRPSADVGGTVREITDTLPGVRIIKVIRRDIVAQFGSYERAEKIGRWHRTTSESCDSEDVTLQLSKSRFVKFAIQALHAQGAMQYFDKMNPTLDIQYERDILNGELRTNPRLFEFVDVEPMEATWLRHRKVSPPPENYIVNYGELSRVLQELRADFKEGASARQLYRQYGPSAWKRSFNRVKFWARRPGYGMARLFGYVPDNH